MISFFPPRWTGEITTETRDDPEQRESPSGFTTARSRIGHRQNGHSIPNTFFVWSHFSHDIQQPWQSEWPQGRRTGRSSEWSMLIMVLQQIEHVDENDLSFVIESSALSIIDMGDGGFTSLAAQAHTRYCCYCCCCRRESASEASCDLDRLVIAFGSIKTLCLHVLAFIQH